jgi:hypothetical protein
MTSELTGCGWASIDVDDIIGNAFDNKLIQYTLDQQEHEDEKLSVEHENGNLQIVIQLHNNPHATTETKQPLDIHQYSNQHERFRAQQTSTDFEGNGNSDTNETSDQMNDTMNLKNEHENDCNLISPENDQNANMQDDSPFPLSSYLSLLSSRASPFYGRQSPFLPMPSSSFLGSNSISNTGFSNQSSSVDNDNDSHRNTPSLESSAISNTKVKIEWNDDYMSSSPVLVYPLARSLSDKNLHSKSLLHYVASVYPYNSKAQGSPKPSAMTGIESDEDTDSVNGRHASLSPGSSSSKESTASIDSESLVQQRKKEMDDADSLSVKDMFIPPKSPSYSFADCDLSGFAAPTAVPLNFQYEEMGDEIKWNCFLCSKNLAYSDFVFHLLSCFESKIFDLSSLNNHTTTATSEMDSQLANLQSIISGMNIEERSIFQRVLLCYAAIQDGKSSNFAELGNLNPFYFSNRVHEDILQKLFSSSPSASSPINEDQQNSRTQSSHQMAPITEQGVSLNSLTPAITETITSSSIVPSSNYSTQLDSAENNTTTVTVIKANVLQKASPMFNVLPKSASPLTATRTVSANVVDSRPTNANLFPNVSTAMMTTRATTASIASTTNSPTVARGTVINSSAFVAQPSIPVYPRMYVLPATEVLTAVPLPIAQTRCFTASNSSGIILPVATPSVIRAQSAIASTSYAPRAMPVPAVSLFEMVPSNQSSPQKQSKGISRSRNSSTRMRSIFEKARHTSVYSPSTSTTQPTPSPTMNAAASSTMS